jgi:hypothetical protein
VAGAALVPVTGTVRHKVDITQALAAGQAATARDLRDAKRDRAMTRRAWDFLEAGRPGAYEHALTALRNDTRAYWQQCLTERSTVRVTYVPTADALKNWLNRHWNEWNDNPIVALDHRDTIRDQALGAAYAAPDHDVPARYEVRLD